MQIRTREKYFVFHFKKNVFLRVGWFERYCDNFQEIRLAVRELDGTAREISLILQQIHQENGLNQSEHIKSIHLTLIFY